MAKVIVTGATGFIGRHVVKYLAAKGFEILAIGRNREKLALFNSPFVTIIEQDLLDPFILPAKWEQSTLIHLADAADRSLKVDGGSARITFNILAVMRYACISDIIFTSTIYARKEFQDHKENYYGRGKRQSEFLLRNCSDINTIVLRLPPLYGPGSQGSIDILAQYVAKRYPMPFGLAQAKRDYLHISNLVDLIFSVLIMAPASRVLLYERPVEPCDGSPTSTRELIEYIATILNTKANILPVPKFILKILAKSINRQEQIEGAFSPLECRSAKLLTITDWRPKFTMPKSLSYFNPAHLDQPHHSK